MDQTLHSLAAEVGAILVKKHLKLATAESCTGGLVAAFITSVLGSTKFFDRGFVTYTNSAKMEMLGVKASTLKEFGAVSIETASEMAAGAVARSRANVGIAITGIAGPGGGSATKPVGTVCFGWNIKNKLPHTEIVHFSGDRENVRYESVKFVLEKLKLILLSK